MPPSPPPRTVITQTNTNSDNDLDHNPAMQHTSSIPEPSSSPKSQLHDAIERIQALHKRRTQIKTIYENERAYLDQRSQKTKSSFEGLIVSTEEQIQSINEFPAFDSHPDYTDVNGKLHAVALDTKALFNNVSALSESILMALDTWYKQELDKCQYEIKLAEKDYKRSFDSWQDAIKSGDLFSASEPFKTSSSGPPTASSQQQPQGLHSGETSPQMYPSSGPITHNGPPPMQDYGNGGGMISKPNTRPASTRTASMDMGPGMSGAAGGTGGAGGNYPPNSSEKRSGNGGKKKTFSWLGGGSGGGKYID
ncbi:hypothetical protein CJF31_00006688 [Rutstroemia sp. NJR-2017a BVV2]|nr:hypothetical protein CJF31_00006688 [Rutstroemia sp. NJR-2017a BVV2]